MKKSIILISVLFFGMLCQAQTGKDTLIGNNITKEVVEKLSNEELIILIKDIEAMKYNQGFLTGESGHDYIARQFANPGFVKGIVMILIISLLLFIVLILALPFYFNFQKTKSFHKMINGFTEKGQEIPRELISSVSYKKSDLHKSIVLMSTGIAIIISLMVSVNDSRIWAIGIIPLIIGVGYLIASRVAK